MAELHALPALAAIPSLSSAEMLSDCAPSKLKCTLFGKRDSGWPFKVAPEWRRGYLARDVLPSGDRSLCTHRVPLALPKATAVPTTPATFSVPARRCRSCPPPLSCGGMAFRAA